MTVKEGVVIHILRTILQMTLKLNLGPLLVSCKMKDSKRFNSGVRTITERVQKVEPEGKSQEESERWK